MVQSTTETAEAPIGQPDIKRLAYAMWQLLDDLGKDGESVCLAAKAEARVAYEPFRDKSEPEYDDWMSLADAEAILVQVDR